MAEVARHPLHVGRPYRPGPVSRRGGLYLCREACLSHLCVPSDGGAFSTRRTCTDTWPGWAFSRSCRRFPMTWRCPGHGGTPSGRMCFFTLFISLLLLLALERSSGWPERMLEVFLAMWFAEALGADYGFRGVLLVLFFYTGRSRPPAGLLLGALWNFLWPVPVQRFGALAMFPLALYSGKRGQEHEIFFLCILSGASPCAVCGRQAAPVREKIE